MWDESLPFFGKVKNFGVWGIGACADFAYVGQAFGDIGIGGDSLWGHQQNFPKIFWMCVGGIFFRGAKNFSFS